MISAFKHIRLSGLNLTPLEQQNIYGYGIGTRLALGQSGLAYQTELLSVSGDLQAKINTANADVESIFIETGNGLGTTLQNALAFSGRDGLRIGVEGQNILFSGNSGYFQGQIQGLSANITNVSNNLVSTGNKILDITNNYNSAYSGWANAEFVAKSSNQVFTKTLNVGLDAYQIDFPVSFGGPIPKVQATLEVPGDVMYNLSVKSIGTAGYTGVLSDNILEIGAKIHTFASIQ